MRKLAIVVIAVVLSLAAWGIRLGSVGGPEVDADAPRVADPAPASAALAEEPRSAGAMAPAAEREAVGSDGSLARCVVQAVDAFGDGVPDARIELRAVPGGPVLAEHRTDRDGVFDGPRATEGVWVTAHHPSVGCSICGRVLGDGARLVLPLLRPVAVTVRVLDRDARPMARAAVALGESWANADSGPQLRRNWVEHTDDQGLLVVEVVYGSELTAAVDEARGSSEAKVVAKERAELLLAALGAFRVEGTVVDSLGRPVAALAYLLGDPEAPFRHRGPERVPGAEGEAQLPQSADFAIDVPRIGRGVVAATAVGFECMTADFEVTLARPRVHVQVVAHPLRLTRGTVVDASGRPCARARIMAQATDGTPIRGLPLTWAEDGNLAATLGTSTLSGKDGAFVVGLSTRCRWRLSAATQASRVASEVECAAGDEGIVLHADAVVLPDLAVELANALLREPTLTIECADGSAPGFPWRLWLTPSPEGFRRANSDPEQARQDGGTSVGRTLLCVMDAASGQSGWCWREDVEQPRTIRLQPPVELEVRVETEAGPARGVVVVLDPCGIEQAQRVNGDGMAPFPKAPVGPAFVRVMRGRETLLVHPFEVSAAGPAKLLLRLP